MAIVDQDGLGLGQRRLLSVVLVHITKTRGSWQWSNLKNLQHFTKKIIIAPIAQKMRFLTPIGLSWKDGRRCRQSTKYSAIMMPSESTRTSAKL